MCDLQDGYGLLPPLEADEYRLDTARERRVRAWAVTP
jgi:hypothetical protein